MPRRRTSLYGSMFPTVAADTKTLDPGLAERERVIRTIRAHAAEIRARGVTRLRLFGSMARGEAAPGSDVDLLIEVDPRVRFTLVELAGLERLLRDLLDRPVEFAFPDRLREHPRIWERVRTHAIDLL
jgi:predicted nucleotidyltransferase